VAPWRPLAMAPPVPSHPNARRIASPAVHERILTVLRGKVQHADVMDAMQKVYVRLLLLVEELPDTDDELLALVTVVAKGKLVDHKRRQSIELARNVDADDEGVIELPAKVLSAYTTTEWKRLFAFVEKLEERGEVQPGFLRVARRLAAGETYEDIAPDEGISAPTLRKRMERERRNLVARWIAYSGVGGAVLALLLFLFARKPKPEIVAAPGPVFSSPPASTAVAVETPAQQAARLRSEAKVLCDKQEWAGCWTKLDEARDLDSLNESRRDVIEMRKAILDADKANPKK
jgi:DNA-directed RNA polymerase specialized sigma24 family protein